MLLMHRLCKSTILLLQSRICAAATCSYTVQHNNLCRRTLCSCTNFVREEFVFLHKCSGTTFYSYTDSTGEEYVLLHKCAGMIFYSYTDSIGEEYVLLYSLCRSNVLLQLYKFARAPLRSCKFLQAQNAALAVIVQEQHSGLAHRSRMLLLQNMLLHT